MDSTDIREAEERRAAARLEARARAALPLVALLLTAAAPPPERLPDPAQEARAHALFRQIRCVVCQNESIDDSDAELADDLRSLVREGIANGRTDLQIRTALTDRYGEFVLLKPRLSPGNAVLWIAPFGIVAAGLTAFALSRRRGAAAGEAPLSPAERERLAALAPSVTVPPQTGPTDTTAAG